MQQYVANSDDRTNEDGYRTHVHVMQNNQRYSQYHEECSNQIWDVA